MEQKKSYSFLLMLSVLFGFQFTGSLSYGRAYPTAFPQLRSPQNPASLGISNDRSTVFDDGTGLKEDVTHPGFDDELTGYLVKNGLYKAGCDGHCPGKCVAHPQTNELICICERGKGIFYRFYPDFCLDCGCGLKQISCSFNNTYLFNPQTDKCYCEIGYEDKNGTCVKSKRPCEENPCKNGGSCWEKTDRKSHMYMCTCPETHTGKNCQQDSYSCTSSPCQNGGVCWNGSGLDYLCVCPETHAGKNCQREVHICDSKPCLNGGTCWRGNGSDHHCSCPVTHTGENCHTEIDPCSSKPCKNGGKCWKGEDLNYLCTCDSDYNGKNCDERKPISTSPKL